MDLCDLTIKEAHEGLSHKEFSSRELTYSCLGRAEKLQPKLNAFITVTADLALKQAEKADKLFAKGKIKSPLQGIPAAIKDVICTRGVQTTAGSKILKGFIPPYEATAVKRLKDLGVVLIGKTNCDEFAMGASNENSAFGPVKNPWNLGRVPGGSSGGSAVATITGQSTFALGSDTGGSTRQPASFCGLVGIKPSYGRVSRYGLIALTSSLDQIGPLAKTVEDAAIVLEAISGPDPYDSTAVKKVVPSYSKSLKQAIGEMKIGIPREYFVRGLEKGVERVVKEAIEKFEELGAKVDEVSLPHTKYAIATYYIITPSEASANLARYDGIRYGLGREMFGDEPKRRIMLGTYALSSGYYKAYYLKAAKVRTLVKRDFEKAFEKFDVLVCPTSPTTAFKLGEKQDPLSMYLADIFTCPANIAGICGISIPCGFSRNLPVGLQILGPQFGEEKILPAAYAYEQATDWRKYRPPLVEGKITD